MNKPSLSFTSLDEPAEPARPRDSATVVIARDGSDGVEVFMLRRHLNSDFVGGAYVFPGGKLDDADRDPALAELIDGWDEDLTRAEGGDEATARALVLCAIRETFEEAGISLARGSDGTPVRLDDAERWLAYRRALQSGEESTLAGARRFGIRFGADFVRFWSRMVTPVQSPKRFDTRFYVARMPEGQTPLHDEVETTESAWVRPAEAVARARAGEFAIIFPTRWTLESLMSAATTGELFASARGRSAEPVTPQLVMADGEVRIRLPDGSLHLP
ncbi:MAG TPA: NUDIX hydrolase [Actinomycetota bacterium]